MIDNLRAGNRPYEHSRAVAPSARHAIRPLIGWSKDRELGIVTVSRQSGTVPMASRMDLGANGLADARRSMPLH